MPDNARSITPHSCVRDLSRFSSQPPAYTAISSISSNRKIYRLDRTQNTPIAIVRLQLHNLLARAHSRLIDRSCCKASSILLAYTLSVCSFSLLLLSICKRGKKVFTAARYDYAPFLHPALFPSEKYLHRRRESPRRVYSCIALPFVQSILQSSKAENRSNLAFVEIQIGFKHFTAFITGVIVVFLCFLFI